jgi:hypothetical protein
LCGQPVNRLPEGPPGPIPRCVSLKVIGGPEGNKTNQNFCLNGLFLHCGSLYIRSLGAFNKPFLSLSSRLMGRRP